MEITASSHVADSQEFKITCSVLVMKLLQNKNYFAYLKVDYLPSLTAVNIFACIFPAGFLLYSDSLCFVTLQKYLSLAKSLKLFVNCFTKAF